MHPGRNALMQRVRTNLQSELNGVLETLNLQPEWENTVFSLHKKKFKNLSVRGPFAAAVYEYILEQAAEEGVTLRTDLPEKFFYAQLPFIAETVITIQYLENHILDGKGGVRPEQGLQWETIKNKLLASHYLKDYLYKYVCNEAFPHSDQDCRLLLECLRRMFQFTEEGQYAEKRWSTLDNVEHGVRDMPDRWSDELENHIDYSLIDELWGYFKEYGMNLGRESFARFYLKRMYSTNALFFVLLAEAVMDLLGYQGVERENVKHFGGAFGLISQFVNDIVDFLPASFEQHTPVKTPEDAYSDLRNTNFTLLFLFAFDDFSEAANLRALNLYADASQLTWFERVKPFCQQNAFPMLRKFAKDIRGYFPRRKSIKTIQLHDFTSVLQRSRMLHPFE